jgi:hypothetical protein
MKGGGHAFAALTVGSRRVGKRKTLAETDCPNGSRQRSHVAASRRIGSHSTFDSKTLASNFNEQSVADVLRRFSSIRPRILLAFRFAGCRYHPAG